VTDRQITMTTDRPSLSDDNQPEAAGGKGEGRAPSAKPQGARARRPARETEQAFIDAATALFAEKGYNGTSIHDLAERLGLTTASLYYHVNGKEDLLFRVLQSGMADFLDGLEIIFASELSPKEKLCQAVMNHFDFVFSNPTPVAVFIRERRFLPTSQRERYRARVNKYDKMFDAIIEETMRAGDIPSGDASLLRLCGLGMINWAVEWYRPDGRLQKSNIRAQMLEVVLVGTFGLSREDVPPGVANRLPK
jgi:TetR/AcrR family transcriptional regulator, cholesterol catabolism regulator